MFQYRLTLFIGDASDMLWSNSIDTHNHPSYTLTMEKKTFTNWFRKVLFSESDVMASYRNRIMIPVCIIVLVLLTIFAVNNLLQGRFGIGLVILFAQALMLVVLLALRRGKPSLVSFGVVVVVLLITVLVAVVRQGILGALWSYPVVLISYFMLSRRLALLFSLGILVTLTLFVAYWVSPELSTRVFATLLLTIIMINIVLSVMGELQEALMGQALTDPLTGAFNRRRMEQTLEQLVEQGRRRAPNNSMLMIDIDHFKAINDRLGHEAGDRVLQQMVAVINGRKRVVDQLYRIGGEEFIVLLIDTNTTDAVALADDVRLRIEQAPLLQDQKVTVSVGICAQRASQSADDWIKCADTAMYRAKRNGRNRVEILESD
jgi:diguanylate cyclase (GGDEF)-like protein